jgi:hypothetical protein
MNDTELSSTGALSRDGRWMRCESPDFLPRTCRGVRKESRERGACKW